MTKAARPYEPDLPPLPLEPGAIPDGLLFDIELFRVKEERVLTLSGDTPVYRLLRDPLLPPGEDEPDEINP